MIPSDKSRQVQSVRKSFRIVNLLQELNGATLTEVSDQLGIAKSTVHNYLATLESMGYVVNRNGTYRLGLRFLTHGVAAKNNLGRQQVVRQSLSVVSRELSHPTWWVVEEFGRGFFLEPSGRNGDRHIYGRVGKRSYLHTHAPGKAILAELSNEEVATIADHHGLPEQTMKTTADLETLLSELDTVRERGFAVSNGEAVLGVQSIGAAFRSPDGVVNAIGAFGYARDLLGSERERELTTTLTNAVDELETTLHGGVEANA